MTMTKTKVLTCASVVLMVLTACGRDSSEKASSEAAMNNPAWHLTLSDLDVPTDDLDSNDVENILLDDGDNLFVQDGFGDSDDDSDSDDETGIDDCIDASLAPYGFVAVENGFYELNISDLEYSCSIDAGEMFTSYELENNLSYYVKLRVFDEFGNIMSLANQTLLSGLDFSEGVSAVDVLFKAIATGSTDYSTDAQTVSFLSSVKTILSSAADENSHCSIQYAPNASNNCRSVEFLEFNRTIMSDAAAPRVISGVERNLVTFNATAGTPSEPYYSAGTADFEINNWVGDVQYRDGLAPIYTATDGSETISGELMDPLLMMSLEQVLDFKDQFMF